MPASFRQRSDTAMPLLAAPARLADHRILLVNDDGIHAPGLRELEEIARGITDDVWVVAPEEEKSGAAHSFSLVTPLRMRRIDERHYAVRGTPTDCVLLAWWELLAKHPPTVILSGINQGENLAEDLTYSGTAAAAMEGALLGARAVALSQVYTLGRQSRTDTPRAFAPAILEKLLACEWERGRFVNVNFPDVPPEDVSGVRLTSQGQRLPGSFKPLRRTDGRNIPYWWIRIAYDTGAPAADTDLAAIQERAVSVTPLKMDMSDAEFRERLAARFDG